MLAGKQETSMPWGLEIKPTQDDHGVTVYRVTVSVGGGLSVVREFKSKEDAEQFASSERQRLAGGPKRA
jgi:hypothetical protein